MAWRLFYNTYVVEYPYSMEHLVSKKRIRDHLRTMHSDAELQTWFDPLAFSFSDSGTLEIRFPHVLFSRWFGKDRQKFLEREITRIIGLPPRIITHKPKTDRSLLGTALAAPAVDTANDANQCSFDTFLYNKKNEFPVAMAREIAASANNPAYNPFIICGKGTCGKTHLLRAIAIDMARNIPESAIYFGTVEDLASLFSEYEKPGAFRRRMLRFKAVLLDNAQRLTAYPDLQEELFSIADAYREKKKPFIIVLDEDLDQAALSQKLRSRLESGLIVTVKKPDLDVRLRFVKTQCAAARLYLKKERLLTLAQRFHNVRTIQGLVTKMAAFQKDKGAPLSTAEFEKILAGSAALSGKPPTPSAIISHVAEVFSLTTEEISGDCRRAPVVRARQVAMYVCRELLGISYASLGSYFNGKNHATVLYACNKIKKNMDSNKDMHKTVTRIKKKFLPLSG